MCHKRVSLDATPSICMPPLQNYLLPSLLTSNLFSFNFVITLYLYRIILYVTSYFWSFTQFFTLLLNDHPLTYVNFLQSFIQFCPLSEGILCHAEQVLTDSRWTGNGCQTDNPKTWCLLPSTAGRSIKTANINTCLVITDDTIRNGLVQHTTIPVLKALRFGNLLLRRMTVEYVVVTFTWRASPDVGCLKSASGATPQKLQITITIMRTTKPNCALTQNPYQITYYNKTENARDI